MNWKKACFLGIILGFWLGYLGSIGGVNAIDYNVSCVNGYLVKNGTLSVNDNTYVFFQNTSCPTGECAYNNIECNSSAAPELFFAFAIAFSLAAFTLAYIALRIDEDYRPLQIMFLMFSMMYIVFDIYIVSGFATLTINSLNDVIIGGYILGIWTVVGTLFYFMYLLVRKMLEMIKIKRKSGRPFKW